MDYRGYGGHGGMEVPEGAGGTGRVLGHGKGIGSTGRVLG